MHVSSGHLCYACQLCAVHESRLQLWCWLHGCLQVGDLMPALKGRFQDANRNLGAQALLVVASLARAMGRPIAREARPVLGPAVKCICDSKHNVSAA